MALSANRQAGPKSFGLLLEKLCRAGVEFILVGGLAAVVQGAPVTTMDVDIVHRRSLDNASRLMGVLESLEARYRRPDDKMIKPVEIVYVFQFWKRH
jgi:hypothetical protein